MTSGTNDQHRPPDEVVPLRRDDLVRAATVLATALADDPGYRYLLPDRERRVGELTGLYRLMLTDATRHGIGFVTRRGAVVTGAVAAYPPGAYPPSTARWAAGVRHLARLGLRAREHSRGLIRFGQLTSGGVPDDAWYVLAVGVRPDLQRAGRGKLLMGALLDVVDDAGSPSYLETTNTANLAYYERFGYVAAGHTVPLAPAGAPGPDILPMRRAALRPVVPPEQSRV